MYVYVPSTETIQKHWEDTKEDPEKGIHFTSDLEIFIRLIRESPETANRQIPEVLGPISHLHPLIAAVEALRQWKINDGSFQHARAAKHLLSKSIQKGLSNNQDTVVVRALHELVTLQTKLKHDNSEELSTAVEYLFKRYYEEEKGPRVGFDETVDLVLDHTDADKSVDKSLLQRLFVICIVRANRYRLGESVQDKNVMDQDSCRKFLGKAIEVGKALDIDDTGLKQRYTEEYRRYAEIQGEYDSILKGEIIDDALRDTIVTETLSNSEKVQWKKETQKAMKEGTKELKRSGKKIKHPPTEPLKNRSRAYQRVFQTIAINEDPTKALYWLVNEPTLRPPFERNQRDPSLVDNINNLYPQDSGHFTQLDPDSDLTQEYVQSLIYSHLTLSDVVINLIDDHWLRERDFFRLLNLAPSLTDHTLWYLTDAVNYIFDKEYTAAIHISIPRIESVLYELLNDLNDDVIKQMEGGTGTRTLTPLVNNIDTYAGEEFQRYIEYAYKEKTGEAAGGNLRNRTSHGHLKIGQDNFVNAVMPIVDILRICYQLRPTPFVAAYGHPSQYLYIRNSNRL
jgi:hypothetical protein